MSVEDEISLPGLVGEPGAAAMGAPSVGPGISLAPSIPAETELEIQSDDEEVSGCGLYATPQQPWILSLPKNLSCRAC